ncbi:HAD family hydrolase [Haloferacaceae archaeon DSL9]
MEESTPSITAVLFDMDGVIVDSERYWKKEETERIFPTALNGEHPDLSETTGMNYKEIYDYLDDNYETEISKDEFVEIFNETAREIYGERVDCLDPFHGLRDDLEGEDVPVAIVSSSPPEWIEMVTDRFEISVDEVVSAEQLDADGKPEPDIYEHAATTVDRETEACLVVEDSKNGSLAAERAGAFVVGYRTDVNAETDLSSADVVAEGPDELESAIRSRVDELR